jgi:hypothetical protein
MCVRERHGSTRRPHSRSTPPKIASRRCRGSDRGRLREVARLAFGDADAVSVGDDHVPNIVAWALAGEPRGSDERMLELLEPYRPHRGRVQRLLEVSGIRAPAFGPRMGPRAIDRI